MDLLLLVAVLVAWMSEVLLSVGFLCYFIVFRTDDDSALLFLFFLCFGWSDFPPSPFLSPLLHSNDDDDVSLSERTRKKKENAEVMMGNKKFSLSNS